MRVVPVSVVIPCHECAATIARAIASVQRQTAKPQEIILVDDASGPDTLKELEKIRSRLGPSYATVVSLRTNVGPASARNAGWNIAKGDFVAFLDADDAWHPRKLEIQTDLMQERSDIAVSGHRASQLRDGEDEPPSIGSLTFRPIRFWQLVLANRFVTPSVMVRRSLPYRFTAGRRHMEDHLLWMQIAAAGELIVRIDAVLAYTFKSAYGASGQSSALWAMETAELENYRLLASSGALRQPVALLLGAYSVLKFVKRLMVVGMRRIIG